MNKILAFIIGGIVGSVVTKNILEKKYEDAFNEELKNIRKEYSDRKEEKDTKKETLINECEKIINEHNYDTVEKSDSVNKNKPYVIPPEEFGENDYDIVSMTYYANGVLVDDNDEIVQQNEIEDIIGDALDHFGEYEDDSVFVRDDDKQIDYEILKDLDAHD